MVTNLIVKKITVMLKNKFIYEILSYIPLCTDLRTVGRLYREAAMELCSFITRDERIRHACSTPSTLTSWSNRGYTRPSVWYSVTSNLAWRAKGPNSVSSPQWHLHDNFFTLWTPSYIRESYFNFFFFIFSSKFLQSDTKDKHSDRGGQWWCSEGLH